MASCGCAWRSFDWDALNPLQERGLIGDPVEDAEVSASGFQPAAPRAEGEL
ncbi:DUF6429 family protein [Cupriavidus numazuensis]|uniref:DUF6429 family protein n=1 Tax=Cupriavidus numazuensis TaxID=221992 RepID=UPI001FD15EEA|nr:DUF6429 family protein [Cupriavidus numazuensis]